MILRSLLSIKMYQRNILKPLIDWKKQDKKKPLIIRGARQVGKTSIVSKFANEFYSNFVNVNLELPQYRTIFEKVQSVNEFEEAVKIYYKQDLEEKDTLLFIDEIQNTPNLISLLRFFYEENTSYDVISAGSLLEPKIKQAKISMPVGRVDSLYLYPLDFFEFLYAIGETELLNSLKQLNFNENLSNSVPAYLEQVAKERFNEYLIVGGMPEAVYKYAEKRSLSSILNIYEGLLRTYADDVYKYAEEPLATKISNIITTAPTFAGSTFMYSQFSSDRDISSAFELVESIMLISQVKATQSLMTPLVPNLNIQKKLLYIDIGLVNYRVDNQQDLLHNQDLSSSFRGSVTEQVTGQHLLSLVNQRKQDIFYWTRPKSQSKAEVDFCFGKDGYIIGIETKSGSKGNLKSLFSFSDKLTNNNQKHILIRIHLGHMKIEELEYAGTPYKVYSIPAYLLPRIYEFVEMIIRGDL